MTDEQKRLSTELDIQAHRIAGIAMAFETTGEGNSLYKLKKEARIYDDLVKKYNTSLMKNLLYHE